MGTKYKTILADPPWNIEWRASKHIGTKELEYSTLPTSEICNMGDWVKKIADQDCRLFLWTTNQFLPEALGVVRSWGFRYRFLFTWCKNNGIGGAIRIATEHLIIAERGHPKRCLDKHEKAIWNWIMLSRTKTHSEKPIEIRKIIEKTSEEPRIELFARERIDGWDAWGNEVPKDKQEVLSSP